MQPCRISGRIKPRTSPRYEHYKIGQHKDEVANAQRQDLVWLLVRYHQRLGQVEAIPSTVQYLDHTPSNDPAQHPDVVLECLSSNVDTEQIDSPPLKQSIPVWRAYYSQVNTSDSNVQPTDESNSLPIINAPAHEWQTLVTVLENMNQLNVIACPNSHVPVMVTLDMDLYKRALKLEYLNDQYKGKWWLLPGAFHTSLCAIRCLGKTVENSGLDEAWVLSNMYSRVTVNQIISGSHYNRAVEAHEITLQVLFDLWVETFYIEKPLVLKALVSGLEKLVQAYGVEDAEQKMTQIKDAHQNLLIEIESMNLGKQLTDFDKMNESSPMYKWVRIYMQPVLALLNFHRSVKLPNFFMYMASLENLSTYFFAYNRLDYAQHILEFTARAYAAKYNAPDIWRRLVAGEFVVTKNNIPFTSIGIDQAQEHANKIIKGEGGLQGITNKPATLLKYCLSAPVLGRLSKETQDMFKMAQTPHSSEHHQKSNARTVRQENAIHDLKSVIRPCNLFCDKSKELYNFMTKQVLREETQSSILSLETRGEAAKLLFMEERICGEVNLWNSMKKLKFLNWDDLCRKVKLKSNTTEFQLKSTATLFSRLMIIARSERHFDLQTAISDYEFNNINLMLMNPDGTLLSCKNKSDLIHSLEELAENATVPEAGHVSISGKTFLIIDGMAVVQALIQAVEFKTCKDIGEAFVKSINLELNKYTGGRVIFDNYHRKISIKDDIRYTSSHCDDLVVDDLTPIKDKNKFLASKKTKDSLTLFLADKLIEYCKKPVVTVTRKDVLTNSNYYKPTTGVSTHEEADTLMMLHALEVVNEEPDNKVDFFTQDTDWWVIILRRLPQLGINTGIVTGTSANRRRVPLQPLYDRLGSEIASALPGFHSITGSDTTGKIHGLGKKSAFKVLLKSSPHILTALSQLGQDESPSPDVIAGCQEFLCMLVSTKAISALDPATLRWKKFGKLAPNQSVNMLPPTAGAWLQHIYRAHLQANLWAQDSVLEPKMPDPCNLGWNKEDNKMYPVLSAIQAAPEAVVELFKCNCTASYCSGRCTCRRNNLSCTELCKSNTQNVQAVEDDSVDL